MGKQLITELEQQMVYLIIVWHEHNQGNIFAQYFIIELID